MRWTVFAAGLLALLFVSPAAAEKRVALVVRYCAHQSVSRLENPKTRYAPNTGNPKLDAIEQANAVLIDQSGKH